MTIAAVFAFAGLAASGCASSELLSERMCAPSDQPKEVSTRESGIYRIETTRLYYGDSDNFSRPAAVDHEMAYMNISYYKIILRRNLTRNDPRYWLLLKKTNEVFQQAVAAVAEERGYDLVGDTGAISASDGMKISDITNEVIERVK
jgi:hypothetical protein